MTRFPLWIIDLNNFHVGPVVTKYEAVELRKTGAMVMSHGFQRFIKRARDRTFHTDEADMKRRREELYDHCEKQLQST